MKHNNLLASIALFGELFNSETYKGIPDILAEFIKGALIHENIYSFDSYQLKILIKKVYEFEIPESVLRTILKNKLKEYVNIENKIYHINKDIVLSFNGFDKEVTEINKEQNEIFSSLEEFVSKISNRNLSKGESKDLFESFVGYLIDTTFSNHYSELIVHF